MPTSSPENKDWARRKVDSALTGYPHTKTPTVLDIGVGVGTYGKMINDLCSDRSVDPMLIGVEAYEPYFEQYGLDEIYDFVEHGDARNEYLAVWEEFKSWKLVVLGDVIEHMPEEDALRLLTRVLGRTEHMLVCTPLVDIPFEPEDGNDFDRHVRVYTDERDFRRLLSAAARAAHVAVQCDTKFGSTVGYWFTTRLEGVWENEDSWG